MILTEGNEIETFDQHRGWLNKRLCRWRSEKAGRKTVMPHIKTYARISGGELEWFLLTSANLSRAAWGQFQKEKTQIYIKSYELGVLFCRELFQVSTSMKKQERHKADLMNMFHYDYRISLTTFTYFLPQSKIAFPVLKNLCQQPLFQLGCPMIYRFRRMDLRMNVIQEDTHLKRWKIISDLEQPIS